MHKILGGGKGVDNFLSTGRRKTQLLLKEKPGTPSSPRTMSEAAWQIISADVQLYNGAFLCDERKEKENSIDSFSSAIEAEGNALEGHQSLSEVVQESCCVNPGVSWTSCQAQIFTPTF